VESARAELRSGHDGHGKAQLPDPTGQVAAQPVRHSGGERGDDDLVEPERLHRVSRRDEGIRVADDSLDVAAGGLLQRGRQPHRPASLRCFDSDG
jgi:hypothetical protein